jgi:hypothetical protein
MFTNKELGEELDKVMSPSCDISKVSAWANNVYSNHCRELTPEQDEIIMSLSAMEHGPEFEYTEDELRQLVRKLSSNI